MSSSRGCTRKGVSWVSRVASEVFHVSRRLASSLTRSFSCSAHVSHPPSLTARVTTALLPPLPSLCSL